MIQVPSEHRVTASSTSQFGKYLLQRKLAEGGMAEVFLAKQTRHGGLREARRRQAHPAAAVQRRLVRRDVPQRGALAARLNHPNVVQIFDLGKLGDQYFIAMEYVHGEDLRAVIREATDADKRPPLGLACRIIADTLAGLHYAHTRVGADGKPLGLVHRDVSPQNVLVTYEGAVKLVDFGIAKATREVSAAQTQAGLLKGKYAYMSPEQARGQPVDARADVFCAGVLLWELATWQRLFKRPTDMATLMAVAEEPMRAPRTVEPSLPPELDRLIMRALARKPEERFASAQEMRAALEGLIRTSGWEADTLALSTWMRELFAGKLRAQAATWRLRGWRRSRISCSPSRRRRRSAGWCSRRRKAATRRRRRRGCRRRVRCRGSIRRRRLRGCTTTARRSRRWTRCRRRSEPIPRSDHLATTLKGGDPVPRMPPQAASSGVIVPSLAPLKATPTAATAGVVVPDAPLYGDVDTPSMNLPPGENPGAARC